MGTLISLVLTYFSHNYYIPVMRKNTLTTAVTVIFVILFILQKSVAQNTTGCWKSFSGGERFSLGITSDGKLWSWGDNTFGQLGLGTESNTFNPIKSEIGTETDWKEVEAGLEHSLALKNNGTLWAWGSNFWGMLGDGTRLNRASPVQIGTDSNWSKVSANGTFTLALKSDGTIWGWGWNTFGQIGDGSFTMRLIPTQIGSDTDWIDISAGQTHGMAIKNNGTLWAWGSHQFGQLGVGDTTFTSINFPIQVGSSADWKIISSGRTFTLAIKKDGSLWSWGQNDFGQLGNGTSFGSTRVPKQIGSDTDWVGIATGDIHSMALKSDGTRWAWGSNGSGSNSSGSRGALGDGTIINKNIPIQIGTDTDWEKLNAGTYFSACFKKDGTLWSNGRNLAGELGDGTFEIVRLIPILAGCPIVLTNLETDVFTIAIYPNPSAGIFTIQTPHLAGNVSVVIYNTNGSIVYQDKTSHVETLTLYLSHLQNGIYLLKIASPKGNFVQKIIRN